MFDAVFTIETEPAAEVCPECHGEGSDFSYFCERCNGTGKVQS
jgi:DnaJ-class molecular chaperone